MVASCGKEDKWLLVAHNRGWQSWVAEEDGGGDTNFVCLVLLSFFLCSSSAGTVERKMRVIN